MNQDQPVYHELIYRPKAEEPTVIVSVCLVRTREDAIPFISSLEVNHLYTDMYKLMENKTALYLHSRINYGANRSVEKLFGPLEECCKRVWKSKEMTEYLNITENPIPWGSQLQENDVPWPVMATLIQAKNVSDSIYLSVKIYIDRQELGVEDVPNWDNYRDVESAVTFYPVRVSGSANVTISPAEGSTLAPLLNGMEVFYVIDVLNGEHGHLLSFPLALLVIVLHLFGIFSSY
ncbi:hypothetical protein Patl1_30834 [Pistacia atlantica]|uniref:Uncharacterized protein n=1 Tax=Pistacia atlantica TaxID=434234 RepID=A0ACC1AEX7_9ROSI|nr:hypothetical protein Patl1_30834 [Pistacia atlantica]